MFVYPMCEVPKKIGDGAYPRRSLENYETRTPSVAAGRSACRSLRNGTACPPQMQVRFRRIHAELHPQWAPIPGCSLFDSAAEIVLGHNLHGPAEQDPKLLRRRIVHGHSGTNRSEDVLGSGPGIASLEYLLPAAPSDTNRLIGAPLARTGDCAAGAHGGVASHGS
ncbi:MAG: hypothetical protein ACR2H2_11335 [Solirubrobacteraceae bacterium]